MKSDRVWTPYLLVAPAVLVFAFVVLLPALLNTGLSFVDWSGTNQMVFVGIDNFTRAFRDDIYLTAYRNTFGYIALTLILEVAVGLVMAGVVTMQGRRTAFYRIAFFVPVMLPMVVIAVLWSFVYSDDIGLINTALRSTGFDALALVWLGNPATALIAISVVSGWIYAGFYMAIFFAALQRIPTHIVEAATLDGASQWRIFFSVKVPMIRPMIEIAVLLCVTGAFQSFDLFYVMTNGGPDHATEIVTTYLVEVVFRFNNLGYGAALATIMTIVVLALGLIFARIRSKVGGVDVEY
ncbi:sugar ABC transporter permease [Salinibacterium sp. G-O1]|uniref:carbohydrate ABC transporter permease n=1 Tax=Salinibacterium sp. G-O1 TaxID=3046208 RepID=UPI0024BB746E|nr:sugar ABC transporter permease [Salinibacterium sp. G-O1]MDJ0335258.1 sugar ABC transporter permease [Salinibacterium sp. G-O1]